MLTFAKVKQNQFSGDLGSIISRIIELENRKNIIWVCAREQKNGHDNTIINKVFKMVLECDHQAKGKTKVCERK